MMRVIRKSVESGEFASTSEVLRDALGAWQRERREHAERLAAIRGRIRRSLDDPRPAVPIDEAFNRIEKFARRQCERPQAQQQRPPLNASSQGGSP